jgi:hypothetical protein
MVTVAVMVPVAESKWKLPPILSLDGQESVVPASPQVFMPLDFSRPARQWSVLLAQGADELARALRTANAMPTTRPHV